MDTAAVADLAKPILCVDTCSLLDIMRDPTRETARAHERQAEIDVVERDHPIYLSGRRDCEPKCCDSRHKKYRCILTKSC